MENVACLRAARGGGMVEAGRLGVRRTGGMENVGRLGVGRAGGMENVARLGVGRGEGMPDGGVSDGPRGGEREAWQGAGSADFAGLSD